MIFETSESTFDCQKFKIHIYCAELDYFVLKISTKCWSCFVNCFNVKKHQETLLSDSTSNVLK